MTIQRNGTRYRIGKRRERLSQSAVRELRKRFSGLIHQRMSQPILLGIAP